jgi:hypothetical protein
MNQLFDFRLDVLDAEAGTETTLSLIHLIAEHLDLRTYDLERYLRYVVACLFLEVQLRVIVVSAMGLYGIE